MIAARVLQVPVEQLAFRDGRIYCIDQPDKGVAFYRIAGMAQWSPSTLPEGGPGLRETVQWSPAQLTPPSDADEINTSLTYGFIADFCGVEIDRNTGVVRIDRYVSLHDSGRILHPMLAEGQIRGALAQAFGTVLYEQFSYGADGSLLSGTFADYLLPNLSVVPDLEIMLTEDAPSPLNPLGIKGGGESAITAVGAVIAAAIDDALGRPGAVKQLPVTPQRLHALLKQQ